MSARYYDTSQQRDGIHQGRNSATASRAPKRFKYPSHPWFELQTTLDLMLEQPSHITELVPPDLPHFYGYVDYAACDFGGVLLPCTKWVQPSVWRLKTPADIEHQTRLQQGTVSNSDGEAAAVLIQEFSMEQWTGCDTRGIATHVGSNNSPTVGWNNSAASRASHKAPETMIWWQALRQRFTRRGAHSGKNQPSRRFPITIF